MPRLGLANRYPDLLNKNEKSCRPNCSPMDFPGCPEVVDYKYKQEEVSHQGGSHRVSVSERNGPTCNSGSHQNYGGNQDQPLVSRGIGTKTKSKKDQRRKNYHIRYGDHVEEFGVKTGRTGAMCKRIRCRQYTHHYHQACEEKSDNSKVTMYVHSPPATSEVCVTSKRTQQVKSAPCT